MKNYGLFIGIDISKKWIDVSLAIDEDKKKMIHRQFDNAIYFTQAMPPRSAKLCHFLKEPDKIT